MGWEVYQKAGSGKNGAWEHEMVDWEVSGETIAWMLYTDIPLGFARDTGGLEGVQFQFYSL